jgi:hypothetical protein
LEGKLLDRFQHRQQRQRIIVRIFVFVFGRKAFGR